MEPSPLFFSWRFVQIEQLKASNAALVEEVQRLKEELSKSKVSHSAREVSRCFKKKNRIVSTHSRADASSRLVEVVLSSRERSEFPSV